MHKEKYNLTWHIIQDKDFQVSSRGRIMQIYDIIPTFCIIQLQVVVTSELDQNMRSVGDWPTQFPALRCYNSQDINISWTTATAAMIRLRKCTD